MNNNTFTFKFGIQENMAYIMNRACMTKVIRRGRIWKELILT